MNLGAFTAAILFTNETGSDNIDDFAGLIQKRPALTLLLSVCLLNLAGLPVPPAGFFAKVFIFSAGLNNSSNFLGIPIGLFLVGVALITSIPAVYYYTRVVIKMIVREPSDVVAALPERRRFLGSQQDGPMIALTVCVLIIFATGTTVVNPVMSFAHKAVSPMLPNSDKLSPIGALPGSLTK
jgi:NAD(P)H-quinone oxidoreductase subunit 2